MNRHFRQQGVTRRKLGIDKVKIRCRWTREQSNALWLGDFSDGPVVVEGGPQSSRICRSGSIATAAMFPRAGTTSARTWTS